MTKFENPFIPPSEEYKRRINPVRDYIEQAAAYLSLESKKSLDECRKYVQEMVLTPRYPGVRFPKVHYLQRQENGDRNMQCTSLLNYIADSIKEREIIAPTFTTYRSPEQKKSILVEYIDDNIKKRSKAKKAMFAAEARGDKTVMFFEDVTQRNTKLSNNAISGAHASSSTPLFNQTSHSTLTSNCRLTSGYGNANNEKLLSGNRHYHNPDIVINNIISIVTHTDYPRLQKAIETYHWHIPSVEDTMECIAYSTDLYWFNNEANQEIKSLIEKLSGIQRAAFVYTGDLYHLRKHNTAFLKDFITKIATRVDKQQQDPVARLKNLPEDICALAHQICAEEMKGKGKDYEAIKGSKEIHIVASTSENIANVMLEYALFIKAIMVTDNVPASISYFPDSIRRAALTSDTDSTIFTVQDWVMWYKGNMSFDAEAVAVASTMIFIASQAIIHILARMSVNTGIERSRIHQIAMKNEFYFPVFVPTSVGKHYFASISCQEGNVYDKIKREIKGVHLKNSNSPKEITNAASEMMNEIMDTVMKGEKLSLYYYIKRVADIERYVYEGIKKGSFFRLGQIKSPDSYKNEPESSPYLHYLLWTKVFAPKYGTFSEPPYDVIHVSTKLVGSNKTQAWLQSIEDKEFAARMESFLLEYGKKDLPTIQIPVDAVASGIPEEIKSVINERDIVANLCKIFYLILETLGYYVFNDNRTFLVSDMY